MGGDMLELYWVARRNMGWFHKDSEVKPKASEQLSVDSSVGEWLAHPVGGAIFRDMLQKAGQNEKVLRPVRHMALKRLIAMSRGQFTEDMANDMVRRANAGEMPQNAAAVKDEPDTPDTAKPLAQWKEKITPGRFDGKTIIVTGAGSGIGRATASRVAREGGRVIAVDISNERLAEFASSLAEADITTVAADITDANGVAKIVKAAGDTIDGLANVAGIMDNMTPLHEMSDEVWERVMNVNVAGMMKLSRAVLPIMLEAQAGTIVNVGSEASLKASAAGTAYTTSKHAVMGLSKSMAFMYGPSGIRTNVVAPGAVLTNIEAKYESKLGGDRVNELLAVMPDAVEADALAASITFLLSDDSVNINGAVLPSDGGWSVQ
jgi:NAD(P)-dependent dehydrogenase (short-subunit alcohol dehydrogenase family)